MNQVKTFLLMVVLTVILVGLGSMIGGKNGAALAFVVALGMNMVSYWFSDRIVLAMYRAQRSPKARRPELYNIVATLAQRASCRCRRYTSSITTARTPSRPGGTPSTRGRGDHGDYAGSSTDRSWKACSPTSFPT